MKEKFISFLIKDAKFSIYVLLNLLGYGQGRVKIKITSKINL